MNKGSKIAIGAIATALMAWGAHGPLNRGAAFINQLQVGAEAAVAESGASGVKVAFSRDPFSRLALLSGAVPDSQRDMISKAVMAVPGVSGARWIDAPATAAIPPATENAAAPAMAETENAAAAVPVAVAQCQSGVNEVVGAKIINFNSGSAYVPASANPMLDEVAEALKPCSGVTVEIGGHTDASGSAAINDSLSQARAERVRDALVARGIPAAMLTAKGYGSSKPANADNAMDPANRRTSFTIAQGGA